MLRTRHGFPRGKKPFGIECVLSREAVVYPKRTGEVCAVRRGEQDLRIDCETGFGTASFVTGTFGFVAAARIVQRIAERHDVRNPKAEGRSPKEGRNPKSEEPAAPGGQHLTS